MSNGTPSVEMNVVSVAKTDAEDTDIATAPHCGQGADNVATPAPRALVQPQPTESLSVSPDREVSGSSSASSSWKRAERPSTPTSSSLFGGSAVAVAAPVPLKAHRAISEEDWERESHPAIPDSPLVAGVRQYYARDLLRIRRTVVEAGSLGKPPVKPVDSDVPAEILNSEPPGASPITPTLAPSTTLETPQPQRARTPKVPDGLPRPRSSTGYDGPGGNGSGSSGRSTPRTEIESSAFVRQSSRDRRGGLKGSLGVRGGGGNYRKASPPLEDDLYGPKRIEEGRRWRPESIAMRRMGGVDPDDPEKKIKRARALLNKLSMEKFDKLSAEFVNVGFTSDALLWQAIDIIVAKAQEEVHFSSMYAELCLRLSRTPLAGLGETDKGKLFRKILLTRCQEEFNEDLNTRICKVDTDPSTAALGKEEREEKKRMAKFRYLGHMRFIGELFLKELLKEEHVHGCIKDLFGEEDNPDEEKLACLCKLLSTTGKKLELLAEVNAETSKKQRRLLNKYFEEVYKLSQSVGVLSSRIRCLLKDLFELRQNNYVPRRVVETAKTLSQVHEEAAREALAKGQSSAPKSMGSGKMTGNSGGGGRPMGSGAQDTRREKGFSETSRQSSSASLTSPSIVDEDGWETVGPKKTISKSGSKQSLGRSASNNSLDGTMGGMRKQGSSASFGAFSVLTEEKRKKKEHKDKRDKDNKEQRKERRTSTAQTDSAKRAGIEVKSGGKDGELAGSPRPSSAVDISPEASSSKLPPNDHKAFLRKGKSILADYWETQDEADAIEAMGEMTLEDPDKISQLVAAWLDAGFQRSRDDHRAHLADLLVIMRKADLLPPAPVEQALYGILESLADTKVDIPKVDEWMAKIVVRLINGDVLSLSFLQDLPEQMVKDGVAFPFAMTVIKEAKREIGVKDVDEMVRSASLNLELLTGGDLEDEKLASEFEGLPC